jgi:hypothetical protein
LSGFAIAAGELFEDDTLVGGQWFAHGGDEQDLERLGSRRQSVAE